MVSANDVLGKDIELDTNYDIIFTSANDVKTNDYIKNVGQAIVNRLQTPMGFFERYPLYGSNLHAILGLPRIESTLRLAESVVYEALLQEPRIQSIKSINCQFVDITQQQDALRINLTVELISTESPIYNLVWDYFIQT